MKMKNNELWISPDHTKINETHYVYECDYDDNGNEINGNRYPETNTFAKVTNGATVRAFQYIDKVIAECTLDEIIAVANYAKQRANTKLNSMKKYL